MPPRQPRRWCDAVVPEHIRLGIAAVFDALYGIEAGLDEYENRQPHDIILTPEAKRSFIKFVNEHGQEQYAQTDEDIVAVYSKLEATAARLALIFHLVRWASDEEIGFAAVDQIDVDNAIRVVQWFASEAQRVYRVLHADEDEDARQELVELVGRLGGAATSRELQRACRRYATAEDAEAALNDLAERDLGAWFVDDHDGSAGRPAPVFRLTTNTGADTITVFPEKERIVSAVSSLSGNGNGAGEVESC